MKALIRWDGYDGSYTCVECVFEEDEEEAVRQWLTARNERIMTFRNSGHAISTDTFTIENVYPSFKEWFDD